MIEQEISLFFKAVYPFVLFVSFVVKKKGYLTTKDTKSTKEIIIQE